MNANRSSDAGETPRANLIRPPGPFTLPASRFTCLLLSASALALYAWTAAPTLSWGGGDSAKLSIWVHREEIGYAAESHPLYVLLGRLFSALPLGGDLAYRLNRFSGFCAALAVGVLFRLCRGLTGSDLAAAGASAAFAVSHTFWLHAVLAEVYALHLLLLLGLLACLLLWDRSGKDRHLCLAAGCFGAGVANHILTAWALPGVVWWVAGRRDPPRARTLLWAAVWAGAGALPLLVPLGFGWMRVGFAEAFRTAAGIGSARSLVFRPERIGLYLAYLFYQFPGVGFVLGGIGFRMLYRANRRAALFLAWVGIPYLLFPLMWDFRDHYQFALSFYACFAVGIAPGLRALQGRLPGRSAAVLALGLLCGLPVCAYASAPAFCRWLRVDPVRARSLPYRDPLRYFLWPSKRGDDGARRYGTGALRVLAPGAVVVGDYTPSLVLSYFREVEGLRPDVEIRFTAGVSEQLRIVAEQIDRRPVYAAALEDRPGLPADLYLCRESLAPLYEAVPESPVYRIRRRE
jgi:hypothetical protein